MVPRRQSNTEKRTRGSRQKPTNYPQLSPRAPDAPDWCELLGDDRAAADAGAWWDETVPELDRHGILARVDAVVVTEAAVCWARVRQAERELGRTGLLVEGQKGNLVRNPVSLTLSSYRQSLKTYLHLLGLSPADRQGLDLADRGDQLTLMDKLHIVRECSERGITVHIGDLDDSAWDLIVPDDICAKYGR